MKYCSKCLLTKSTDAFGKDKYQQDGLTANCKSCRSEYSKNHYLNNKAKVRESHSNYYKNNKDSFSERSYLWQKNNRDKANEKSKKWREANLDRARECSRLGSHRRRARALSSTVEPYTEQEILNKYGSDCHICGIAIDMTAPRKSGEKNWQMSFHIDHYIEICNGGSDTLDNVRPSHGVCNIRRRRAKKS
jgi:hypothetical protein